MEQQIICLKALKAAYENMDRLNNTSEYTEKLKFINTVIEKGVTHSPDPGEDDEEEKDKNDG